MSNFIKAFFVSLFLFSCDIIKDRIGSEEVKSGVGQVKPPVFSKTCSQGSVKIQKTTLTPGPPKNGEKVTVTGKITQGGCGFNGAVFWTCSAVVQVDTNRIYQCESGTVRAAVSTIPQPVVTTTPSVVAPAVRSFQGGYAMVHNNGLDVFAHIKVSPQYAQFGWACPMSFACGDSPPPLLPSQTLLR